MGKMGMVFPKLSPQLDPYEGLKIKYFDFRMINIRE